MEMQNIVKEFPGVRALDDVTFKVRQGEIHALVGENGAGKSTLMKVLSGVYPHGDYSGDIIVNSSVQMFQKIKDSEKAGIAIIYQELALVKQMNVAENIFLGEEITKSGLIRQNQTIKRSKELLERVGLNVNPLTSVSTLGIGQQQLVEIAKALSKSIKILILDEPTAALNEIESENLMNLIRGLKKEGVTCIYISHKLGEVKSIADRITVLRDGKSIVTVDNDNTLTEARIISSMVGREMTQIYPYKPRISGEVVYEVKNLTVKHPELADRNLISDVSFNVKRGEILGIAGLMGAGRTELALALFGVYSCNKESVMLLEGKELKVTGPKSAIDSGICYLSEDRKKSGLVLMMDVKENTTLASLDKISNWYGINVNEEIRVSEYYVKALRTKTPNIEQKVRNLSGGNQQKVALAKWLMAKPKLLILDEPTRGIDVGAKFEIYSLMNELIDSGVCVIMISSELPEVIGMSDRIVVLHEGKISGEVLREDFSQEHIMHLATGTH